MLDFDFTTQRGDFTAHFAARLNGPITGVVGPSGAGKTSLLRALAGLDQPTEGYIDLYGQRLFDSEQGVSMPTHTRGIGVVFQDVRLFPHLSVRGNLEYAQPNHRQPEQRRDLLEVTADLGIKSLLNRSVRDLSGGESKRVALARAVLGDPRVLLLDEPLVGLDEDARNCLMAFLLRISETRQLPILCVSHLVGALSTVVQELVLVNAGECRTIRPAQMIA